MKVFFMDYCGKGQAFSEAMREAGFEFLTTPQGADCAFFDCDADNAGRTKVLDFCTQIGVPAALYPHGAGANLAGSWDGLNTPHPAVVLNYVPAIGFKKVIDSYRYPAKVVVTGWHLCALGDRKRRKPKNILFAPTHPPYNGVLSYYHKNQKVYRMLCDLLSGGLIDSLTVRHLGTAQENGIDFTSRVEFHPRDVTKAAMSDFEDQLRDIDQADVVIGEFFELDALAV